MRLLMRSDRHQSTARVVGLFVIVLLGGFVVFARHSGAQELTPTTEAIPLERHPYDVRLLVAFDTNSSDTAGSEDILREVGQAARRCVGDLWSFKTHEITWLSSISARGLDRLNRSVFAKHFPEEVADVWFIAAVEARAVGTRVSVRGSPKFSWKQRLFRSTCWIVGKFRS